MSLTVRVDASDLIASLTRVQQTARRAGEAGLGDSGDLLLSKASAIVPLDEGPLDASGKVVQQGSTVEVGFGSGPSAQYAIPQHENTRYRHRSGRTAHYLSGPTAGHAADQERLIAARIEDAL